MEKQPHASIIVPVHNAQDHVGPLVDCLKAQTNPNFEAILVNDGSTDDTQVLLAGLVEGDSRFRLLYQPNSGPGTARNTGLAAARGVYALFMDADDLVKDVLVERVLDAARGHAHIEREDGAPAEGGPGQTADVSLHGDEAPLGGPDIICYQINLFDERDRKLHDYEEAWDPADYPRRFDPADYAENLFNDLRNWPWNKAFRLEFLRSRNIRFPALHRSEDLAFTCSALAAATSIELLDECLYTYRVGGQSSSTSTRDPYASDFFASACALHDYLEDNDLMGTFQRSYRQWVGLGAFLNLVELETREGFDEAYAKLADGGLQRIGIRASQLEGGEEKVAGRYVNRHVKSVLEAVETGSKEEARKAAEDVALEFAREDRMKLYVQDYGAWLGPRLCRLTQPLHERKAARAQAD